jgi:cytochrome c biogenesis protein CcdA
MLANLVVYGLSFFAGVLSILSPCVLPLLPIIIGAALNTHIYGTYALALGLATSFTAIGIFIVTIGTTIGINHEVFRVVAALLLILFGVVLVSISWQEEIALAATRFSNFGNSLLNKLKLDSLIGQYFLGLLLGVVWSPCVGPILGATITLASQGENLTHATFALALFGLGAGFPLILLGMLSRQSMMRVKSKLVTAGKVGKYLLGVLLILLGLLIIFGLDKKIETLILSIMPDWLVLLTTKF